MAGSRRSRRFDGPCACRRRARSIRTECALRLLVDIAIRALSPAVNDPTTAVQALDQIEDLMRRLGRLRIETRVARDAAGAVRVIFPASTWEDCLSLAFDEIRQFGAASVQVDRRLRTALHGLIAAASTEARRAASAATSTIWTGASNALRSTIRTARPRMPSIGRALDFRANAGAMGHNPVSTGESRHGPERGGRGPREAPRTRLSKTRRIFASRYEAWIFRQKECARGQS